MSEMYYPFLLLLFLLFCSAKNSSKSTAFEYVIMSKNENTEFGKKVFLDSAIMVDKGYAEAYLEMAKLYRKNKNVDSAIYFLNIFLKLEPLNADGYAHRGLLHVLSGNVTSAENDISNSFNIDSSNVNSYYASAIYYKNLKQNTSKANQLLFKAIQVDSTFVEAYYQLAYNLQETGATDSAYSILKEIISREIVESGIWGNFGLYAADLKRYDEAFAAFDSAAKIDSLGYAVYWNRSLTYLDIGDTTLAINDFNRYLRFAPYEDERKPAIREKITELGGKPEY